MDATTTSHFEMTPAWNSTDGKARGLGKATARPGSRVPLAIALGVALAALIAGVASLESTAGRLRALPPAERVAVVERAVGNLRDVCRASGRPREFCKAQAELALALPECTQACQALAREELRVDGAVK